MERHDLDPIALVFGAAFVALGVVGAITQWTWLGLDRGWVAGVFLVALGVAGAVSATRRSRRRVDP